MASSQLNFIGICHPIGWVGYLELMESGHMTARSLSEWLPGEF